VEKLSALLIRETGFEISGWLALIIVLLFMTGGIVSLQWIASIREYEISVVIAVLIALGILDGADLAP
jgi:uncharacterized membrane protein YhaH (DUF805 family)